MQSTTTTDYIETNRLMWQQAADLYQQEGFADAVLRVQQADFSTFDKTEAVIFQTLIELKGLDVLQVGCNNGLELICLKKNGAAHCVGIDISETFIRQAVQLSQLARCDIDWMCSDVYAVADRYADTFDLLYITVGVLGWLPDLNAFFAIANQWLRSGGRVFIYEQHPLLNTFNPIPPHLLDASYFRQEPFADEILPEYIDKTGQGSSLSYWFPHTLSAILTAILTNGLTLTNFQEYEHDLSDTYKALEQGTALLPLSFSLIAQKK